jgi:hypothetical protein
MNDGDGVWSLRCRTQLFGRLSFQITHLGNAAFEVLLAARTCIQIRADEIEREPVSDDLRTEAENVGVVVFDALVRGVDVVGESGTDTGELVGGHACSYTGATDHHSPVVFAASYGVAHASRDIREVDRFRSVSADVGHLESPVFKCPNHGRFELVPGVIGSDDNPHGLPRPSYARDHGALNSSRHVHLLRISG